MKPIYFCRLKDKYGEFSNFYRREIYIDQKWWPSTEHYYQAQKHINDPEYMEIIRKADRPWTAAELGRDPEHPMREDWNEVKEGVMIIALTGKFTRHKDLKELLLSTGNAELFEYSKQDSYWGTVEDYKGKNRLGECLMIVRRALAVDQDLL